MRAHTSRTPASEAKQFGSCGGSRRSFSNSRSSGGMSNAPGDPGKGAQAGAAPLATSCRRPTLRKRRPGRCRVTTAASMSARTAGRLGSWLSVRHSLHAKAALVLTLYGLYELARGMVVGNAAEAVRHARQLVTLERSTGLFIEERMQDATHAFPGLIDLLGISYLTFHLAVTVVVLLWLHRRRPAAFPLVRTTLVLASGLALVGYLVYPTAPPRLSGIARSQTPSRAATSTSTRASSARSTTPTPPSPACTSATRWSSLRACSGTAAESLCASSARCTT